MKLPTQQSELLLSVGCDYSDSTAGEVVEQGL